MPGPVTVPKVGRLTVRTGCAAKAAPTLTSDAGTVTWQLGALPEQPSDQPVNWEPVGAAADSCTAAPTSKVAVQAGGQEMPAGWLVTVPLPATATVTDP